MPLILRHDFTALLKHRLGYCLLLVWWQVREKLAELMFEKYNVPALFLGRSAVMSCFATCRQSSVIVDMGHQATTGDS